MPDNSNSWREQLIAIGKTAYYKEHRKILKEMAPDGKYGSAEWNEASAEALIAAMAAMIEENNTALLTEIECSKDSL